LEKYQAMTALVPFVLQSMGSVLKVYLNAWNLFPMYIDRRIQQSSGSLSLPSTSLAPWTTSMSKSLTLGTACCGNPALRMLCDNSAGICLYASVYWSE
jgi:hypothetical protein